MKIKNLAFYGVMAAILGSVGTARADDSTIIASKGYVDAYAQKKADRVQQQYSTYVADSNNDETKKKADYPSMYTLEQAINGVDLSSTLNGLDYTQPDTGVVKTVSQTDGLIAVTAGTVDTAEISDSAVTYAKVKSDAKQEAQVLEPGDSVTPWNENDAPNDKFPTVKAVAQQIGAINLSSAVEHGPNALLMEDIDDKAPSVIAVKGIADNTTTAYTTRDASTHVLTGSGSTTKVPTTAAVVTALKELDGLNADGSTGLSAGDDNAQNMEPRTGQPVVKVTQTDGQVKAELGAIGTNGIQDSAVTNLKLANEAVDFRTVSNGTKETSGVARDQTTNEVVKWGTTNNPALPGYASDSKFPTVAAVAQQIAVSAVAPNPNGPISPSLTDHSIVTYNADGLVTGGISLPGLNDINAASGGSSGCDADNPCVLSYYVDNGTKYYKWTKMDIVDLDVVNDTTQSATTGA